MPLPYKPDPCLPSRLQYNEHEALADHADACHQALLRIARLCDAAKPKAYLAGIGLLRAFKYVLPWLLLTPLRHYFHYLDLVKRLVKLRQTGERLDHVARRDLQELQAALAVLKGMQEHMTASAQSLRCSIPTPTRFARDVIGAQTLDSLGISGDGPLVYDGSLLQVKATNSKAVFLTRQKVRTLEPGVYFSLVLVSMLALRRGR